MSGNYQTVQRLPHETRIETDRYFHMKFRISRLYVSCGPRYHTIVLYIYISVLTLFSILISNKQIKTLFFFLVKSLVVRKRIYRNRIPVTMDCLTIDKSTQWRFTRRVMLDSAFFSVDHQLTVCDVTSVIEVPRELNKIIGCQKQ